MTRKEMLETLSEAITLADSMKKLELGDKLFEVLQELKAEWNMEEE